MAWAGTNLEMAGNEVAAVGGIWQEMQAGICVNCSGSMGIG